MTHATEAAEWPDTFDFIVVGGGQSGLVVASRLTQDPSKTVLVLEAGANHKDDPRVDTPGFMTTLYDDPEYDWKHMTVPQENANGRSIAWPRGKGLGGTSSMNFSALVYPAKSDFDNWAALGNPGWGCEEMAPYLRRFHKYQTPAPELAKRMMMDWVDADAQGYDGPVPASFTPELGPFNEAWMETFKNLGYHTPGDPITGSKQGVFQNPLSIDLSTGKRASSASTYYTEDVARRANLQVVTNALVERLILQEAGQEEVTATGVEFVTHSASGTNLKHTVHATKEVILACGAIKTPQLLELSGIGSPAHLAPHGIDVVVELPQVGENLQDHVLASISYEIADDQVSGDILRDPSIVQAVTTLYQETHAGPLSGTPLSFAYLPLVGPDGALPASEVASLLDTHLGKQPSLASSSYHEPAPADGLSLPSLPQQHQLLRSQLLDRRESTIELMYIPLQLNGHPDGGATDMTHLFSKAHDGNYVSLVAMLMHPFSRGSVHLAGTAAADDPTAAPPVVIDPRYLSHPLDVEMLARAVLFLDRQVAATEPLASLLKRREDGGRRIPSFSSLSEEPVATTTTTTTTNKNNNYSNNEHRQLEVTRGETDAQLGLDKAKEVVRQRLFTAFHPSGTCAMLPRAKGGVVDARLRVYGTRNVRVVDASVFPLEPLGHLQATVYAVAERAADLIQEDW